MVDGQHILPMATSQDHKRVGEGDTGPNTGGMGAYAPVPFISEKLQKDIFDLILQPAVAGLAAEGHPFTGVLYAGLMITDHGPRVIEFNCRFGDPETQAILPLLKSDLAALFLATVNGELEWETAEWQEATAVCVIAASEGYPRSYEKGKVIYGLKDIKNNDVVVFHSGTRYEARKFLTAGGRVLGVTAVDENIEGAIHKAYEAMELVRFEGKQFRSDIAMKAINKRLRLSG
ncbi:MAG: phosphoribosylamine--glycine ligase, partial [candidate division Zixibacteria bacterium]|nr:phosphoribosylamine--glycine ligase [candidate division Zixibacteria bacterium]